MRYKWKGAGYIPIDKEYEEKLRPLRRLSVVFGANLSRLEIVYNLVVTFLFPPATFLRRLPAYLLSLVNTYA